MFAVPVQVGQPRVAPEAALRCAAVFGGAALDVLVLEGGVADAAADLTEAFGLLCTTCLA